VGGWRVRVRVRVRACMRARARVRVRVRVRVRTRVSVSVEQVRTFWAPPQLLRVMETSSRSCRERPGMPSCSLLRTFCVCFFLRKNRKQFRENIKSFSGAVRKFPCRETEQKK
jgi:hypothetical protein